jgi:hypothetical protein
MFFFIIYGVVFGCMFDLVVRLELTAQPGPVIPAKARPLALFRKSANLGI